MPRKAKWQEAGELLLRAPPARPALEVSAAEFISIAAKASGQTAEANVRHNLEHVIAEMERYLAEVKSGDRFRESITTGSTPQLDAIKETLSRARFIRENLERMTKWALMEHMFLLGESYRAVQAMPWERMAMKKREPKSGDGVTNRVRIVARVVKTYGRGKDALNEADRACKKSGERGFKTHAGWRKFLYDNAEALKKVLLAT